MKRFLLMLVICVSSFMIYTNNVKATTYPAYKHFKDNYIICSSGYSYCDENLNIFTNRGTHNGTVLFTFVSDPQLILNSVSLINSNESYYPCELGTQLVYSDNTTGYTLYTATCPIYLNDGGVSKIRFKYDDSYLQQTSFKFTMSDYYSFTFDANDTDYSTILSQINSSINSLNTALGGKLDNTNTIVNNIYQKITLVDGKLGTISGQITAVNGKLDNINNNSSATASNTEEIKNDIKSDNVSGAEGSADDLKNNSAFQDNTGLSGVISMPLTFVNSLTNTCQPINLNIPYMDVDVTIPCMQSVITDKMPLLANLIKIIVNGFIVYRILLDIFQIVRNAKNPEDDRIEVLDL